METAPVSSVVIPDKEFALLQRSIHNQRYQQELALETMPREVYSTQLMEAMRREEMAMRDGVRITNESANSIDEMLRNETCNFYRKISKDNEKRWVSLQKKVQMEYDRFYQSSRGGSNSSRRNSRVDAITVETATKISATSSSSSSTSDGEGQLASVDPPLPVGAEPSAAALDEELLRLEADYNSNWLQYEGGNLQTAFAAQMERVESEWSQHEQSLSDDYNRKKISEKIGHNRVKEKSAASAHQQKQFAVNMESLQSQKAASQRWMRRQDIRLASQAQETAPERAKIGALLEAERTRAYERKKKKQLI